MSENKSTATDNVNGISTAIVVHDEGEQKDYREAARSLKQGYSPDATPKTTDACAETSSGVLVPDKDHGSKNGITLIKDQDEAMSPDLKEKHQEELEDALVKRDHKPAKNEPDKADLQANKVITNDAQNRAQASKDIEQDDNPVSKNFGRQFANVPSEICETQSEIHDDTSIVTKKTELKQSGKISENGQREGGQGEEKDTPKGDQEDVDDTKATSLKSLNETVKESHKKQKQSNNDAWSFSDTEETKTTPLSFDDNAEDSDKKQQQMIGDLGANGIKDNAAASHSVEETGKNPDTKPVIVNDKTATLPSLDATDAYSNKKQQASDETITASQSLRDTAKSKFRIELRFRLVKTAALVTTWICIGLFTELTGPTFKDLESRLNLPQDEATEAVSRATSGRSVGFFVGAVIGGFLVDRFKRKGDLFIGLALFCASGVTIAVPWMSTLWTMWFLMFCQGTFEGVINVAGQEIILLLWGEKSAGPMHLLHFGFGMGSFLNPLIAQPFLGTKVTHFTNSTLDGDLWSPGYNSTNASITVTETIENSRIEYAYLIASIFTAVFSSTFFWYQCHGVPRGGYVEDNVVKEEVSTESERGCKKYLKIIDPASCADGRRLAGLTMFFLLFMYFFQAVGGERIYSKFIRNFALDMKVEPPEVPFSSSEASYLNSTFWISFSIGRFLGFIIAIWVPIKILILVECFGALGFATLLNIFGRNNKLALWVLTQAMGLFVAPLFPSGVAWSDHYLKMSGVGIMILIGGGSFGGVCYIWILGYLYPKCHTCFLYMVLAYGIAAAVFACLLSFAGYKSGDRFQKEKMEAEMLDADDKQETITYTNDMKMDKL